MDKSTIGHLHNRILLSHNKEENYNSMDGPEEDYAKWNKPVRERHFWFHSYVESNEQTELTIKIEKQTHR